jgi:hypothetical protein
MRFLCIDKPAAKEGTPPTPEMMETMGKFIEQGPPALRAAGKIAWPALAAK